MYGTRDAGRNWELEIRRVMVDVLGFAQGAATPCNFWHQERNLRTTVHGDDFSTAGAKCDLGWFGGEMRRHYECTIQPRMGPGPEDANDGLVLNRVVRWTETGLEYETDPRQAAKLIEKCGLRGANTMATPGVRSSFAEVEKDEELDPNLHTASEQQQPEPTT